MYKLLSELLNFILNVNLDKLNVLTGVFNPKTLKAGVLIIKSFYSVRL